MFVFYRTDGVILVGIRMYIYNVLVYEEIIYRVFIIKKISLILLFFKILLFCFRLKYVWGRCRFMLIKLK